MKTVLIVLLFVAVMGIIAMNIYFRVNLYKDYKYLSHERIDFDVSHIFNSEKRQSDLYPRYEEHRDRIENFASKVNNSIKVGVSLFIIIIAIGLTIVLYE